VRLIKTSRLVRGIEKNGHSRLFAHAHAHGLRLRLRRSMLVVAWVHGG